MGLRSVTKNKLLLVIVLCFSFTFIVREKLFVGKIKKLMEEAAQGSVKNESAKIMTTSTTTTTPEPWIPSSTQVRLWMDIPSAFPWRHCIEEYNNIVTLLRCYKVRYSNMQVWSMVECLYQLIHSFPYHVALSFDVRC